MTWAAFAKARSVASASPNSVSIKTLSGTSSHNAGAPGRIASSLCWTNGSSSYSTRMASAASNARALVAATTIATASPTWRALSDGSSAWGPMNTVRPPGACSFMSNLVFGTGSCGSGASLSAAQSAPVNTPSTPGIVLAAAVPIPTMRACGCGERTIAAYAWPSRLKSSVKRPRPVTSRSSSLRGKGLPMKRKPVGSGLVVSSIWPRLHAAPLAVTFYSVPLRLIHPRGATTPSPALGCTAMAIDFDRRHQVPGAIDQAHAVRRIFMQDGDARVVEALRHHKALRHQGMALDQGTAHETVGDHHQRPTHAATPAHDKRERIGDPRVKGRPVLAVGRAEIMSKRIFGQIGISHPA